jgi:phosphoribosylanthranilate isomerase
MIVKICGVTRAEDARAAARAGADWIGLNFWPRSRRHVSLAQALAIAEAVTVPLVGVFVDQPADFVEEVREKVGLVWVQLHGDEDAAYCARFDGRYLRALRVGSAEDLAGMARYPGAHAFLLDTPTAGYGGSGRTWDWALLGGKTGGRFLIAGGLTPENVGAAIAAARPFGVDVAGGVESAPGIKDASAMARFVAAARGT